MTPPQRHRGDDPHEGEARGRGAHGRRVPASEPPGEQPAEAADGARPTVEAAEAVEAVEAGEDAEELRAKCDEYLELAKRVQADFENYKKRMLREQTAAIGRASERVIEALLPIVDDMDLTLTATDAEETAVAAEHLADAVRLVRDKLLAVFAKEGVEVIDPVGEPFDPNFAEAMMQVPRDDLPEHTVVEVYQKGYKLGDRLLRAAKVVVSHQP
jgi:molecular chaperone GrpE